MEQLSIDSIFRKVFLELIAEEKKKSKKSSKKRKYPDVYTLHDNEIEKMIEFFKKCSGEETQEELLDTLRRVIDDFEVRGQELVQP